ncbi:non-ribosomal peptide synthetase [Pedobacter alluvionis]|uniref:Amino acid adenylation domain-containing protein n=1 Tax=Pedobacter alluvionis TaxID=475253 RepID=A0A497YEF0_9SPHI|nr:non-ribosomal peptide synthetase [Pedobacter alluvionis]RLJ80980.1 amino acid adenylation domain-containing protein [Pedobacter alluvionis]TFB29416.1 amino acid adenylation domain-containing protein [Pedobacter alluvionis]
MKQLLKDIRDNHILLEVIDGKLNVFTRGVQPDPALIAIIKERKDELTQFLLNNNQENFSDAFRLSIPNTGIRSHYPLSSAQRRLWVLSQNEQGSVAYNMSRMFVLEGALDINAFQHAFRSLIIRHESLRTAFREDEEGEISQFIIGPDETGFSIVQKDLRSRENELMRIVKEELSRPFDLSAGCLLRAGLFRTDDQKWVFTYVMHHIISDGWSMGVLIRELLQEYQNYTQKKPRGHQPLSLQYKDYAAWQQDQLKEKGFEQHRAYWLEQCGGSLPILELPADKLRPAIRTYNGSTVSRKISPELSQAIKGLSQELGGTLFVGLLATVNALLYRYTYQEDIIIGSPIAGRDHIDLENQIGFYVNMLPLRSRFDGSGSFKELFEKVNKVTLEAFEYQNYPFDELVEAVQTATDISRHALFDVVVVLQNTDIVAHQLETSDQGELSVSSFDAPSQVVSLFDLRFDFREINGALLVTIDYNTDIYLKSTIERLIAHFEQLLSVVVVQPEMALKELDYLTVADKNLVTSFNRGHAAYPEDTHIAAIFEEQVARVPDHIAVVLEDDLLTYRQLNERSNQIANFLIHKTALKPEEGVGILLDKKPDCIAAMLGVLKAGGMYIPMDTTTPEERLQFIIKDAGIRTIITEKSYLELANRLQWSVGALQYYLCLDSTDVHQEKEVVENVMMNQDLWDHVGRKAVDQITGGGWSSSFTAEAISEKEMEEYAMNAFQKLNGSLNGQSRVLEIGCSSGLTLSKIAANVGLYYGTDISPVILENTRDMVAKKGFTNVKLKHLAAHDIKDLEEGEFDLIIINSVIQHFHGLNYLRQVLKDAISLLGADGRLFIGDIMDVELKEQMLDDLKDFKRLNKDKKYLTKTDFSADLFVARGFFEDMQSDIPEIESISFSNKIYETENELTRYRYDALITIDKRNSSRNVLPRKKYQYDNRILALQSSENPGLDISPDGLAYVIYTSGTTGLPKGVLVQHNNVVRLFMNENPLFDFNENDVWTMFHSYSFDFSVWEMYGALLFGGKLILVSKMASKDPSSYHRLLKDNRVTILNQTPSAFYHLIRVDQESSEQLSDLRYVIFGGEALSPGKLLNWKRKYPEIKLINMYGITETTVHVTYKEITELEIIHNNSNIGKPIPTLNCYILDPSQHLLPVGIPGELYVGGKGVARGYLNRPELTNERFISNLFFPDRLYRSGDKVRLLETGEMEYLGRIDDQVKIRGFRIELGEIKNALDKHDQITDAVVISRENKEGDKFLAAYIVSDHTLTVNDLRDFLLISLPEYMVPAHFIMLEQFPLTKNGKVDKKLLPLPEGLTMTTGVVYQAARNQLEADLTSLFSQVLNIEKHFVGVNDNFFAMGGDSIKAIRLIVQIKKQLNKSISIGKLYEHQTIAELSLWLDAAEDGVAQEDVYSNLTRGLKKIQKIREEIEEEDQAKNVLPDIYEDIYPVSQVEQGMIYSSTLNPAAPVYYDQFLFFLEIKDFNQFKEGVEALVQRHPILRTKYFIKTFSQPVKVVLDTINLPISYEDLSALTEAEQQAHIRNFLEKDLLVRLDFDDEILWRFKIHHLNGERYFITWSIHHAAIDGWSVSIFNKELTELLAGKDMLSLPPLKNTYKDYCAVFLGREKTPSVEMYWKELLAGYTRNKLPFNYKGTKISDYTGMKYVSHTVKGDLLLRLQDLSTKHQLAFKSICLAAHLYLLHTICAEQDVVTGMVTHDRPPLDNSEYIMGCFLNTVPVRVDVSKPMDILSFLKSVNNCLTTVKPNEIHLSEIAKIIEEKTGSSNPIFDTILNYTDFHLYKDLNDASNIKLFDADRKLVEPDQANMMTNTLFDVEVGKTLDHLSISIKYTPAYFRETEVKYALDLYIRILDCFCKDVTTPLSAIRLLTPPELKEILYNFNDTISPYSDQQTLHGLLEDQVKKTPEHVALTQDGETMSYLVLNEKANQLAHLLLKQGVLPAENIGLLVKRGFDMIVGMFAILKCGASYVPIDPEYPTDRQEYIALNSRVAKILTDETYPLSEKISEITFLRIDHDPGVEFEQRNPNVDIDPLQLAYTIYTSGSTGRPKGVMIAHNAAVNLVEWVNKTYQIGAEDRLLFITSMCFDLSVYDIFGLLAAGGAIVIARQEEVQNVALLKELLKREHITFWDSVPTTMNYLIGELEEGRDGYLQEELRLVFLSGDWIPVQLPDRIIQRFPNAQIISLGGATEGTVWSNFYPVKSSTVSWSSIPYGKPISNNFFYILDDHLRPVPKGVAGELYIGGLGVAYGYANDPIKTEQSFKADPFHHELGGRMYKTGDLGRLMADGNMEFLGRKDDQVKIRGYRVELGEIESVLLKHEEVKEAIVSVSKDSNNNNQLCAYVVMHSDLAIDELKHYLKDLLPFYMVPHLFIKLTALPLNSNGKIDRKKLPVPELLHEEQLDNYEEPKTELELKIAELWKRILQLKNIGIKDDFFDIGANSLSVGAFVNRLHKELDFQISIPEVFLHPTIEGIVGVLNAKNNTGFQVIKNAEEQDFYPLSSSQRQLWVLSQFEENSLSYHIPAIYKMEGILDIEALKYAFKALISRHEILRTVFKADDAGIPGQFIIPFSAIDFSLPVNDLRQGNEQEISSFLKQEFIRAFDLATGPLIRIVLVRSGEEEWILACTMHHIISDGWSAGILVNELRTLYNHYVNGNLLPLPPLNIQYKDYAVWQQELLSGTAMGQHRGYWLKQFEDGIPVLNLPTDKSRPSLKSFKGGTVTTSINASLTAGLKALLQLEGQTLFMGITALINALFYKYTNQEDIVIGTPVAGRDHADLEEQIGFYVNTLALRTRFDARKGFVALLANVKEMMLGAYEHQVYPFDELVYDLNLKRDLSRGSLFDVMIVLQNNHLLRDQREKKMGELIVTGYEQHENNNSKFDLTFDCVENGEELLIRIEYDSDLFYKETVDRLGNHLEQLLEAILMAPSMPLTELNYLSAAEEHKLLNLFNDTEQVYPESKTLKMLFEEQVARTPLSTALIFGVQEFSYLEINTMANRLAAYLKNKYALMPDDLLAIKLERSEWMIIAILAVLKTGAGVVPVDARSLDGRADFIVKDSGCKGIFNSVGLTDFIETSGDYDYEDLPSEADSGHLAFVIYTSGSTGFPKGCMIENKGVINHLFSKISLLDLREGETICHSSELHFVGGIWQLFAPLIVGGSVYFCNREELLNTSLLLAQSLRYQVNTLELIPSQLNELLLHEKEINLEHLNMLILTGEKLNPHFLKKCQKGNEHLKIVNTYGQTELSDVTASYLIDVVDEFKPILVGSPIQNTRTYVLSGNHLLCPIGVFGELCTSGDGLCRGYMNLPELTAEKFVDNPYLQGKKMFKTGDLGRWLSDGTLEVVGRKDDQVKIRGHRIELGEIENALLKFGPIEQAIVLWQKKEKTEKELIAYFVATEKLNKSQVTMHLIKNIPDYMVPSTYVQLDQFPSLDNGKVNKKALLFMAESEIDSGIAYLAPSNETEHILVDIWEDILQIKGIGVLDNFFLSGGHSLKATTMVNKIRQSFLVAISIKDVFQSVDIQTLAQEIQKKIWLKESAEFNGTSGDSRETLTL